VPTRPPPGRLGRARIPCAGASRRGTWRCRARRPRRAAAQPHVAPDAPRRAGLRLSAARQPAAPHDRADDAVDEQPVLNLELSDHDLVHDSNCVSNMAGVTYRRARRHTDHLHLFARCRRPAAPLTICGGTQRVSHRDTPESVPDVGPWRTSALPPAVRSSGLHANRVAVDPHERERPRFRLVSSGLPQCLIERTYTPELEGFPLKRTSSIASKFDDDRRSW